MIEAACSIPGGTVGAHLRNDSTETHTSHEPLVSPKSTQYVFVTLLTLSKGVCMMVTPFNFPVLIGLVRVP